MTNHVTFGQDGEGNVTEVVCFSQAEAERIWISILLITEGHLGYP